MARILFRIGAVKPTVDEHPAGERVFAGINWGHGRHGRGNGRVSDFDHTHLLACGSYSATGIPQLTNSASGSIGSRCVQKILKAARMGTARMTPTMPHIQPQKVSERRTRTGLRVSDRPITKGVMKFPSRVANNR